MDQSENMDEFLKARGINWFKRQIFKLLKPTRVFEKSLEVNGTFNVKMLTPVKNIIWKNVPIGKEFEADTGEGMARILFEYVPETDKLIARHIHLDRPNENPDIIEYNIIGNDLVLRFEYNGVEAKRVFKKVD
uniref:Uncharacterized protein n=1 Tax=Acrobeloides nanus TaxID=290746 RepID=A0A914DQV1_9BILA